MAAHPATPRFYILSPKQLLLTAPGLIEVESPYLWNRDTKQGTRPIKNRLNIISGGRSLALEKVLVDPRIRQSYQQAAKQFEQHYGWNIDRYRIRRSVVKMADLAQEYVCQRLESSRSEYNKPLDVRPGCENILVELDGCHLRTGIFQSAQTQELTKKRQLPKKKRTIKKTYSGGAPIEKLRQYINSQNKPKAPLR